MEQFLPYLPKVICAVALLYFMANPLFRHQNTLHATSLLFGAGGILVLWLSKAAPDYRTILIVLAVLLAVSAALRIAGTVFGWDAWILFNVPLRNGTEMETALREKAADAGISPDAILFHPRAPFFAVFRTRDSKAVRRVVKDSEIFIRQHLEISFWNLWGWVVAGMILLIMLWRF